MDSDYYKEKIYEIGLGFADYVNEKTVFWESKGNTVILLLQVNGRSYLIFMDNQFDPNQHRTYETTGINLFAQ